MIRANDTRAPKTLKLNEREFVEKPLLAQLEGLGWRVLDLAMSTLR